MKFHVVGIATVALATTRPTYSAASRFEDNTFCTNIQVLDDATFCVEEPVCSGIGSIPLGKKCPQAGTVAVSGCSEDLKSYDPNSKTCVASVYATCYRLLASGGRWGYAWNLQASRTLTASPALTSSPQTTNASVPATMSPSPSTTAPTPAPGLTISTASAIGVSTSAIAAIAGCIATALAVM